MAVKTLVRVTSSPSVISEQEPLLSSVLLQVVHQRLEAATSDPLPNEADTLESAPASSGAPPLTEQAVMVLTLIDALPHLGLDFLEEWLHIAAASIHHVADDGLKQVCRNRFWEILTNGEMDNDRAALCVAWWTTKGGRGAVMDGTNQADNSIGGGALGEQSKL